MRVLAIVCVRNESVHISRCLSHLIADGIDVILIDNQSTDDTVVKAGAFLGRGLISIETLPWRGVYSLADILQKKTDVAATAPHDWIVHADADEWLCAPRPDQTLRDGIREADLAGFNCINFHEFAFVPEDGDDFFSETYGAAMLTYYFFQPRHPRLMRAWRRDAGLDNRATGGHRLAGADPNLYPRDFHLRHYLVLSETHARQKYLDRPYDPVGIAKGFHGNRRKITAASLKLPAHSSPYLRRLASPVSREFDTGTPVNRHYWEWPVMTEIRAARDAETRLDWSEALAISARLRTDNPDEEAGYEIGIRGLRKMHRYDEASAVTAQALAAFPDVAWPVIQSASLAIARQDWAAALRLAEDVLMRFPDHPAGYRLAAQALRRLGRGTAAADILRLAAARSPD